MKEPRWVTKGRTYIGQEEVPGPGTNPNIARWLKLTHASFTGDEPAWCATFLGGVLEECGVPSDRSAWARDYLKWGIKLITPILGCVVVCSRGVSEGHVGIFLRMDPHGNPVILQGNSNAGGSPGIVNIGTVPLGRVLGYRWPATEPYPTEGPRQPSLDKPLVEQPKEPPKFEPKEAAPVNPSMTTSKTGTVTIGGGIAAGTEVLRSGNDIAREVATAKETAHTIGVWDLVMAHPGVWMGLIAMAACAFVWWDHRRYRRALSESQQGLQ